MTIFFQRVTMSYCPSKESNISRDFQSSKLLAKENPPYILHVKPHRKIPHQICGVLHYTVNMTLYLRRRTGILWCKQVQTQFDALVLYKAESRSHLSSEALSSTFQQGKFLSTFQQANSYFQVSTNDLSQTSNATTSSATIFLIIHIKL